MQISQILCVLCCTVAVGSINILVWLLIQYAVLMRTSMILCYFFISYVTDKEWNVDAREKFIIK